MFQRIVTVILVCLSLVMVSAGWQTTTHRVSADVRQQCQNIQLLVRLNFNPGAAAGTAALVYRIHNRWSTPCRLRGYPAIELLDRQFRTVAITLVRARNMAPHVPIHQVTLDTNHDAYFALVYTDVTVLGLPCHHVPYLLVRLPGDRLPVVIDSHEPNNPFAFVACGRSISVSPVEPTPRLPQLP